MELGKPIRTITVEPLERRKQQTVAKPKETVEEPCARPTMPTR
jgi:hypothetical protein